METLHSTFLQSLGVTLIDSLWQFALLWLVYVAVKFIFKMTSSQKYSVAIFTSFAGLVWFIATLFYHLVNDQPTTFTTTYGAFDSYATFYIPTFNLLPIISLIYIGLLILNGIKWTLSYNEVVRIKKDGLSKIPVEWRLFVNELTQHLSIKKKVSIFLSSVANSPMTIGYLKPIILIPIASLNHLTNEQMEAVILHEMAHIKRLDYLYNIVLSIAEAILFFNPFMHLLSRDIKLEREHCCDDLVLQFKYHPQTYANALLRIASTSNNYCPNFALHATKEKKYLLERIKRIIDQKENDKKRFKPQLIAFLCILLNTLSFHFDSTNKNTNDGPKETTKAENNYPIVTSNILHLPNKNLAFRKLIKHSSANQRLLSSKLSEAAVSNNRATDKNIIEVNDHANVFYTSPQNNGNVKFIHVVNNEQQNEDVLKAQLTNDVTLATEQARQANKPLDAITLKTMMLARVRKMIAENEYQANENKWSNKSELVLLERKLAYDIIHNVLESNQCKIEKAEDKIIFHYYLPEDDNGNNYSFEYIIHQNNNEEIVNNKAEKEMEKGQNAEAIINKHNMDTLVQHHLKTIRI